MKKQAVKLLIAVLALIRLIPVTGAAAQSLGMYADHNKVAVAVAKGGPLIETPKVRISVSRREKAGVVEVHEKDTDVFYVADGEATLVTGGTVVKAGPAGASENQSSDIKGGQTHHLSKGDVVVIPAGTPHWFKEVPRSISYHLVKTATPAGGSGSGVTYVDHEKVADALANKKPIFSAPNLSLSGGYRTGPDRPENHNPAVEVHAKAADIFYVIDGAATLVTGGSVIGGKETGRNEIRGTEIRGGHSQPMTKGDVMLVPSGTPHWFTEYPKPFGYFRYLLVKVNE